MQASQGECRTGLSVRGADGRCVAARSCPTTRSKLLLAGRSCRGYRRHLRHVHAITPFAVVSPEGGLPS